MSIFTDLPKAPITQESLITVGMFDGVHRGHAHVITSLVKQAKSLGMLSGVLTFRNHPASILQPDFAPKFLTDLEEKLYLIEKLGVDFVIPISFDTELSNYTASEFCAILQKILLMRGLVVGEDFAMGRSREGDVQRLVKLKKEMGFSLVVIDHLLDKSGRRINSTEVRKSLSKGDMEDVTNLLGRPFVFEGKIIKGAGRGHSLGFPTANLQIHTRKYLPRDGIYATWAILRNHRVMAATSIGMRPTFGEIDRTIEAHLLEFEGDIYGQNIRLEMVKRLRDVTKQESIGELQTQITCDIDLTRSILQPDLP